jgi:hypothetical protein
MMQFQLAETYTTNQNALLDQFSAQLNELTEAVHAETNSRRRAEIDYVTLLQRFTGLCKLYAERCSDPNGVQTHDDSTTVVRFPAHYRSRGLSVVSPCLVSAGVDWTCVEPCCFPFTSPPSVESVRCVATAASSDTNRTSNHSR